MSGGRSWQDLSEEQQRRVRWALRLNLDAFKMVAERGSAGPLEAQYVRDGIEAFEAAIRALGGELSGCRECGAVDPCAHDAGGGR